MRTLGWWVAYLVVVGIVASAYMALFGGQQSSDPVLRGINAGQTFSDRFLFFIWVGGYLSHLWAAKNEWIPAPGRWVKVLVVLALLGSLATHGRRFLEDRQIASGLLEGCLKSSDRQTCDCTIKEFQGSLNSRQRTQLATQLRKGNLAQLEAEEQLKAAILKCRPTAPAAAAPRKPTILEIVNGEGPQEPQQPVPGPAGGAWARPAEPPRPPSGEVASNARPAPSIGWKVASPNAKAILQQDSSAPMCTLSCARDGKEAWRAEGRCQGDSDDLHFVSDDCERSVVFFRRPSGRNARTKIFASIYDRARLAWDVQGAGISHKQTLLDSSGHLVMGLGSNDGERPRYAPDGLGVEFSTIENVRQTVPLNKAGSDRR